MQQTDTLIGYLRKEMAVDKKRFKQRDHHVPPVTTATRKST